MQPYFKGLINIDLYNYNLAIGFEIRHLKPVEMKHYLKHMVHIGPL